MFPRFDLYYLMYADPAQPLTTAGDGLDYVDHGLGMIYLICLSDV